MSAQIREPFVLVQNNHVAANTALLARAARDLEIDVVDVSFPWSDEPIRPQAECVFVYGSVFFVKALRSTAWAADIFWSEEAFRADHWAARYGRSYLGADGRAIASQNLGELLPAAVRPMLGDKAFRGGVYQTWTAGDVGMAWASPIQKIAREVRVWVINNKPVCAGQYRPDVRIVDLSEIVPHVPTTPLANIVVDLALVDDGWKIVEFNCLNTSGFYAVDPGVILPPLAQRLRP